VEEEVEDKELLDAEVAADELVVELLAVLGNKRKEETAIITTMTTTTAIKPALAIPYLL